MVDNSRWNSSEGIYSPVNGSALYIKSIKDGQGKIMAVKKTVGNIVTELRAKGVYTDPTVTVTTNFCKQFDKQKIEDAKKCQNFLSDFFKSYEDQGTPEVLKTLQEVAKYDGVPAPVNVEALTNSLKMQTTSMKMLENRSIIANIGYLSGKCADLKRYTTEEAPAISIPPEQIDSGALAK